MSFVLFLFLLLIGVAIFEVGVTFQEPAIIYTYNPSISRWMARYSDDDTGVYFYGRTIQEAVDKCRENG